MSGPTVAPRPAGFPLGLAGAVAPTRYVGGTASGAPASGTFAVGDFVVDQTGIVWVCTVAGTPGTWQSQSSTEAGYIEKTDADFTTSSIGSAVDVTGLSLTVVLAAGRYSIEAGGSNLKESANTGLAVASLVQVTGGPTTLQQATSFGAANQSASWFTRRRRTLTAGTYTFKVQLTQSTGAGTATIVANANAPAWLLVDKC